MHINIKTKTPGTLDTDHNMHYSLNIKDYM